MTPPSAAALQPRQEACADKLAALDDAVAAARETFRRRVDAEFEPVGEPTAPDCETITHGATIALTGVATNYTFALVADADTAAWLARRCGHLGPADDASLAPIADALCEIPSLAADRWLDRRGKAGDRYRRGLPVFMHGNNWLTYFSKGVHAISQRLAGPEGMVLQVVMIWQSGVKPGGVPVPTTGCGGESPAGCGLPQGVLQEATRAVVDTCAIQMGLTLASVAAPCDPHEIPAACGSIIALTDRGGGGWNLAVLGSKDCCEKVTRILFAMEADEIPAREDLADGVGEIANVAAGVFKANRLEAGQCVQIGLPLFLEEHDCRDLMPSWLQGSSQRLEGPDGIVIHVLLTWRAGRP